MAATKNTNTQNRGAAVNKADLIVQRQNDLSRGQNEVLSQFKQFDTKLTETLEQLDKLKNEIGVVASTNPEIKVTAGADGEGLYEALKRDLQLVAIQNENIFNTFDEKLQELEARLQALQNNDKLKTKIDYDRFAEMLVAGMASRDAYGNDHEVEGAGETVKIDYDLLADKMINRLQLRDDLRIAQKQNEVDYDLLAMKVKYATLKKGIEEQADAIEEKPREEKAEPTDKN